MDSVLGVAQRVARQPDLSLRDRERRAERRRKSVVVTRDVCSAAARLRERQGEERLRERDRVRARV